MGTACSGNTVRVPGAYKTSQHNKINRIKVKLIGRLFLCAVIFFAPHFDSFMPHSQIILNTERAHESNILFHGFFFILAAFGFSLARSHIHNISDMVTMYGIGWFLDNAICLFANRLSNCTTSAHSHRMVFAQAKRKRHFMQGIGHKHQSHNISK